MSSASFRHRRFLLASILGTLMAVLATPYAFSAATHQSSGVALDGGGSAQPFTIKGKIAHPIWVGQLAPLNLTFVNGNPNALTVGRIRVVKQTVSAPRADATHPCTLADFRVKQPAKGLRITVPANTSRNFKKSGISGHKWPAIGIINRPVNQDGCMGATVKLTYSARGTSR